MFDFHFISGLPRSGTTLLAAILRQNPAFHAHVESPTGRLFVDAIAGMGSSSETSLFVSQEQRRAILEAMFWGYYSPLALPPDCTIFDNNRKWCASISALGQVFPDATVFACVRPMADIIDSLERVLHKHPLYASVILHGNTNLTLYDRIDLYNNRQNGLVGWAWHALRSAYYGPDRERLSIIRYEDLARYPGDVLKDIHQKLDLASFEYDFQNVQPIPGVEAFDKMLRAPGLHTVAGEVKYQPRTSILPPDVLQDLHNQKSFW